jgi:hypothetical protein
MPGITEQCVCIMFRVMLGNSFEETYMLKSAFGEETLTLEHLSGLLDLKRTKFPLTTIWKRSCQPLYRTVEWFAQFRWQNFHRR